MTNKIWKNIKNLAYSIPIAAMSFLPGCEPDYELPTASINVNPKSGDAPLSINVKGYGTPGTEDIKAYTLYVDNWKKTKSTPFDTTFVLNNVGDHKMHMEVKDTENKIDLTDPVTVTVYQGPYIEQTASLINDNEISYSATLSKKSSAELKVKKDGLAFLTLQITDVNSSGVDFQKTFKYNPDGITKGNYQFVLKADDLEKNNSIEIQNYKPTTDLSGVDAELMEGVEKTVALPTPLDKNPEDNPVAIRSATSLDDKTQTTLNGNNLTIKPLTYTGDYQIEIEFGSTAGGLEKAILNGTIIDDPRMFVNPFVQPNDTTKAILWNNLNIEQRIAHFNDRLYNYDKTDELNIPGGVCSDYVRAWIIAFHGYPMEGLENNNWHNVPGYDVTIRIYNKPTHAAGGVNLGSDVADINDWRFIETQNDSTYTPAQLKGLGAYEIEINYTRVIEDQIQGKILENQPMLKFVLNNNGEWIDSEYRNPNINLIEKDL